MTIRIGHAQLHRDCLQPFVSYRPVAAKSLLATLTDELYHRYLPPGRRRCSLPATGSNGSTTGYDVIWHFGMIDPVEFESIRSGGTRRLTVGTPNGVKPEGVLRFEEPRSPSLSSYD